MEYIPNAPPTQSQDVARYVHEELQKIADMLGFLGEGKLEIRHVAPEKPRYGIYLADGTNWNPGGGFGLYLYNEVSQTYTKL